MARTFLITFKQNDAAEAFVKAVTQLQSFGSSEEDLATSGDLGPLIDKLGTLVAAHATVNAMLARPTTYCKCPKYVSGWTKTEGFGWYVCPVCLKPNRHVVARWIHIHCGSEVDLLPALLKKLFPEPDKFVVKGTITGRIEGPTHLTHVDREPKSSSPSTP